MNPTEIEQEFKSARSAIRHMQRLSDTDFVKYVRDINDQNPSWINLVLWSQEVRRELDMRLLLRPLKA